MLIAVIEPDRLLAARLQWQLGARGCRSVLAHDYADAEALIEAAPVLAALYVAERVPPLAGADLLSALERAQLSSVPTVAVVQAERSLLALALRRGGVETVMPPVDAAAIATVLVQMANAGRANYDWRASMLGWARYLRARTQANRRRVASTCADALQTVRAARRISGREDGAAARSTLSDDEDRVLVRRGQVDGAAGTERETARRVERPR